MVLFGITAFSLFEVGCPFDTLARTDIKWSVVPESSMPNLFVWSGRSGDILFAVVDADVAVLDVVTVSSSSSPSTA